ncbi:MAG TPA: hypothetical protein VKA35_06485 [Solirubrobacterales bacterium]|nr:hypothetical protein [Solirubrobacterales bacterium]
MSTGRRRTFFHCHPAEEDPGVLLDPDKQVTEPWGEPNHGPCDKCGGSGTTVYECFSCLEAGSDPKCPACSGRVRFDQTCPACQGSGEIQRTRRRGVAVFPAREGLYRYLAWKNDANVEGKVVVEMVGELSEDRDLDADHGALLIHPEELVSVEPLDAEVVHSISNRVGEEDG